MRTTRNARRDAAIHHWHAKGKSVQWIAGKYKITSARVSQILSPVPRKPRTKVVVHAPQPVPSYDQNLAEVTAACVGYVSHTIEEFARRAGIPSPLLAERVGEVLHNQSRR